MDWPPPDTTYAVVTWINDEGQQCHSEGYLLQTTGTVILSRHPGLVSCIPRSVVRLIQTQWKTPARAAANPSPDAASPSSSPTAPTTNAQSVTRDGNG